MLFFWSQCICWQYAILTDDVYNDSDVQYYTVIQKNVTVFHFTVVSGNLDQLISVI